MKNFISFVFGAFAAIIGGIVAIIFGITHLHKNGIKVNSDYRQAHNNHLDKLLDAMKDYIFSIGDDFNKGIVHGCKYNSYEDRWKGYVPGYKTYFKTLITLKNVTYPKEANVIEAHIYDEGLYFDWCDYNHDGKYSFICYDDELDFIEEYLTNASIEFEETDADDLNISQDRKIRRGLSS